MRIAAVVIGAASLALVGVVWAQGTQMPTSLADLKPGEGWQETQLQAGEGMLGRAWADPADGCQLLSLQLEIPATAQVAPLSESFTKTLAARSIEVSEQESGAGDTRSLQLRGPELEGIALLELHRQSPVDGLSMATLRTCTWNQREPASCRAVCRRVLQSSPAQSSP